MPERIVVRQKNTFEIEFLAADPHGDDARDQPLKLVSAIHELTPYGMMLAGLGSCTSILLHTYAQNHGVDLHEVELRLSYDRVFQEDCETCEEGQEYREQINKDVVLRGDLSPKERKKLFVISKLCPVHHILKDGVTTSSRLVEEE